MKKQHNTTLDIVRVFCILWVICVWHFSAYLGHTSSNDIVYFLEDPPTYAAMGSFFLISGYLLNQKYTIHSKYDACFFLKRRWLRIYPLYFAAVLFYLLTNIISTVHFIKGALGLGIFNQPMTDTLWFVEVIMLYYIIFVIVWSSSRKRIVIKSLLLFFVIILTAQIFEIDPRFILYYPFYILGMLTPPSIIRKICNNLPLAFISTLVFVICYFIPEPSGWMFNVLYSIRILVGLIIIFCISHSCASFINHSSKYLKWLGAAAYLSMAAYMFHRQIIIIFYHLWWPADKFLLAVYFLTVIFPVIFLLSYFIQSSYDKLLAKITSH